MRKCVKWGKILRRDEVKIKESWGKSQLGCHFLHDTFRESPSSDGTPLLYPHPKLGLVIMLILDMHYLDCASTLRVKALWA